jgi:hypothetical protein
MTNLDFFLYVTPLITVGFCLLGVWVFFRLVPRPSEEEIRRYRAERQRQLPAE